ncbi:MAG TPA: hypothetical protein VGH04_04610 [Gemmatimonadaceae bacterium]|jgi:hypothetical protein
MRTIGRIAAISSLTAGITALFAVPAGAQRGAGVEPAGVTRAGRTAPDSTPEFRVDTVAPSTPGIPDIRLRRLAPIASAIAPGSGQLALGNQRFIVYTAAELVGWWRLSKSWHEQSQQEAAFKAIARTVARSHFSSAPPDGGWTYYENMRDYLESGVYSMSNNGSVVPETDTLTYNGHLWQQLLATNATTNAALSAYQAQAIKPNFQWSWRNAQLQYDQFIRTTDKRNDAAHAAVQDLLFIAANHVLSMVDAFATFRLQIRPESGGGGRPGASFSASARW